MSEDKAKLQEEITGAIEEIFKMIDEKVAVWDEGSIGHAIALQIGTNTRNLILQIDEFFKTDDPLTGIDKLALQVARQTMMDDLDALRALEALSNLRAILG